MKFYRPLFVLLATLSSNNHVFAEQCEKTLMGNDCHHNQSGIATHMRGNAVENAKASKALKAAKRKAQKEATSMSAAKHQHKK